MDHQWGKLLTVGGGVWVWLSIQLNHDTEMMLYLIRDATGKTISTYVEYIGPQADVHLLPPGALRVDVLGYWKSPATGVNYPSGWHLEVNNQQLRIVYASRRSEEHTSELQSHLNLVCRLLLEKKKTDT